MESLDTFYLHQAEPQQSCLLALRELILDFDEQFTETRKYGMPCFLFGKKICCYLWTDKKTKEPYMLMAAGKQLAHPALETGKRAKMKILRIDPEADLPINIIDEILRESTKLIEKGAE